MKDFAETAARKVVHDSLQDASVRRAGDFEDAPGQGQSGLDNVLSDNFDNLFEDGFLEFGMPETDWNILDIPFGSNTEPSEPRQRGLDIIEHFEEFI